MKILENFVVLLYHRKQLSIKLLHRFVVQEYYSFMALPSKRQDDARDKLICVKNCNDFRSNICKIQVVCTIEIFKRIILIVK